ncbi:MAG: PrsW family intramembrane metalloprotease [Firmicutes bacterium]|nr:PrsW family intramembrane metalloprotease [Bacillota bacterium]
MFFLLSMNPILIAAAVIPAIFLLIKVYKADRLDKEPPSMLISLVLLGVASTFAAMITERIGSRILQAIPFDSARKYNFFMYFIVVACSEEGFKYLALYKRTWKSVSFNCQFDGVVYATFVSLGFALWENIQYVLMYGFSTALVRAVTAVPGHACFGVFMGTWYGLAKRFDGAGNKDAASVCKLVAFLLPTVLHGAYDYIASMESSAFSLTFVGFVAIMFIVAYSMVVKMSKNDRYIDNPGADRF